MFPIWTWPWTAVKAGWLCNYWEVTLWWMSLHQKHSSRVPWLHSVAARVAVVPDIGSEMLNLPVCAKTVPGAHSSSCVRGTVTPSSPTSPCSAVPLVATLPLLSKVCTRLRRSGRVFFPSCTRPVSTQNLSMQYEKRGDNILVHFVEATTKVISICHSR